MSSASSKPSQKLRHTGPVLLAILCIPFITAIVPLSGEAQTQATDTKANTAPQALRVPVGSEGSVDLTWVGPDEVRAGQDFEYSLRVTNSSKLPVYHVVVTQQLPGGVQIIQSSPQPEQTGSGGQGERQSTQQQQSRKAPQQSDQASQQPPAQGTQEQAATQSSQRGQASTEQPQSTQQQQTQQGTQPSGAQQQQSATQGAQGRQASAEQPQSTQQQQPQQSTQGQRVQQQEQTLQQVNWNLGTLEAGQTKAIRITATAQNAGGIGVCAWVSFLPALCRQINVVQPELQLTQRIIDSNGNTREQFYACETLYVHYQLKNTGSGATSPATIVSDLPQGLSMNGGRQVRLAVGVVSAGETIERTVRLDPTQAGTVELRSRATTGELQADSNQDRVQMVKPELSLRVQAPRQTYLGRAVAYQISVTNNSDVPALNTVVEMPAPAGGLRFVSNDQEIPQEVDRYQIGRIDPGETRTFGVSFEPSEVGTIGTTATASAYCADAVTKKISTKVVGVPAVQISVIDRQDPIKIGESTVYEVRVINEGTAEDLNIELSGQFQGPLEFVEGSGESRVTGKGQNVQFAPVERLTPGDTASWLVTGKGTKAGNGKLQLRLRTKASPAQTISSEPTTVY